jgi:hypothetical protein
MIDGTQTFKEVIEKGKNYEDKTSYLAELISWR